jgi:signal transduction histidine kinase
VKRRNHWVAIGLGGFLVAFAVVSLTVQPSYPLTIFADFSSTGLWLLALLVMLWSAFAGRSRTRLFWLAMAASALLAGTNLALWLYYDVILQRPVPEPFWADIPLFLQPVPVMAAAALQPHRKRETASLYLSIPNFFILVLWWVYLYCFLVFPVEYISVDPEAFDRYYNTLYIVEFMILLAALGGLFLVTQGVWRKLYLHLFLLNVFYVYAFQALNSALTRGTYHPGSFYDLLENVPICWLIWIALAFRDLAGTEVAPARPLRWSGLLSGLTALAVLSIPVMGIWPLLSGSEPAHLTKFRLVVTLVAMFVLGACVFLRQGLLDRELVRLLATSRESLDNLERLQNQLVQKEKLASLGQLVAGAAHEINNPVTAILGYSELLGNETLTPDQLSMSHKIGQQARRIRDLVSRLLRFAQQAPGEKTWVDIQSLLQQALRMEEPRLQKKDVCLETHIPSDLPAVFGNASQLLQACTQIIENAVDAVEEVGGGTLRIMANRQADEVVLEFSDSGPGIREPEKVFDPFYTTKAIGKGTGLGLSAAYGVVQNHGGQISCHNHPEGGASFVLRFPAAPQPGQTLLMSGEQVPSLKS